MFFHFIHNSKSYHKFDYMKILVQYYQVYNNNNNGLKDNTVIMLYNFVFHELEFLNNLHRKVTNKLSLTIRIYINIYSVYLIMHSK